MNLPEEFIRETRLVMGEQRFNRFMEAFNEDAPVSIRLNPLKISRKEEGGRRKENTPTADSAFDCNLTPHSSLLTPRENNLTPRESNLLPPSSFLLPQELVPWCPEGYYLSGRPQFTFDPLFHAGCYYVQEAASMFITHIVKSWREECGGRSEISPATDSTLGGNLTPPSSLLTPRENNLPPHSSLLTPRISALDLCAAPGGKSTAMRTVLPKGSLLVSNEPIPTRAQILLENITKWGWPDCIVTNNYPRDFRKAKARFDIILCDVPCSGEGMFRKDPNAINEWSLQNVEKCWRLQREIVADAWECLNPGGFLIYSTCTFNIKENEENVRYFLETYDAEPVTIPTEPSWNITGSLLPGFDVPVYRFIPGITRSEGLFMCALRKSSRKEEGGRRKENTLTKELLQKNKCLKIMDTSNLLPPSSFLLPQIDLSYSSALRYLRGEALVLPPDTPRGLVTVTYKGFPLGPVKNIGNRANNLYPKSWRIKTTHLPSEPVVIICKS